MLFFRLSSFLFARGVPVLPRLFMSFSRWFTGIEIHPAAKIGKCLFIDHGIGVIIGETAVVGDNCIIYQGATLGGSGQKAGQRHPRLGNNVVLGAGCTVLGGIVIGDNCWLGANAVLLPEVQLGNHVIVGAGAVVTGNFPDNCVVAGVPARKIRDLGPYAGAPPARTVKVGK